MLSRNRLALGALIFVVSVAAQAQTLGSGFRPGSIDYIPAQFQPRSGAVSFGNDMSALGARQGAIAAPEYSPFLMNATSLGAGMEGTVPLRNNIFVRISIISLFNPSLASYQTGSQGMLMPVQLGARLPIYSAELGTLGYSLYGEGSAGLLFGWAFPTNGSFMSYSLPNSRFTSGASAYAGIGNTLRVDRYVGLYLNGGLGYFDLFSSTFMPQTRYLVPSLSVGFLFNFVQ